MKFTIPAAGLWRVALEALPGQVGLALLSSEDQDGSHEIWQGATPRSAGTISSPVLFLAEGSYAVTLGTADAATVYRLRLEPGPGLPPDLSGPVNGAFTALVTGTDAEIVIPWTVESVAPGRLWTLSAQGAPGLSLTFTLRDATGNTVLYTSSPDEAGMFRLPDLPLPAGAHELSLSSLPAGTPLTVSAIEEDRPAGFAAEADDQPELAHPMEVSRPIAGRLVTNGSYGEHDYFAFTVPDDGTLHRYDVILTSSSGASLSLALMDANGSPIVQRDGARQLDLRALVLPPGRAVFRVSGALAAEETYTLLLDEAGPQAAGAEIEPNDVALAASLLPPTGTIAGSFEPADKDYLELSVPGGLQLWQIEAIGEGITGVNLYDGAGQVIVTAYPSRTNPLVGFSRLLLPPGSNVLRLEGTEGDWLLRASPIGPPVEGEEIEPNDDATRAMVLLAGRPQLGWLERSDDRDIYTFHLGAAQRVSIALDAPAELAIEMRVWWGDTRNRLAAPGTTGAPGEDQRLTWEGLLPPGDYLIELASIGGISRDPYTLTLDVPSFFDRPLDLEPNDLPTQAVTLTPGRELTGVIQGDTDSDWYALDPAFGAGPLTIRAAGQSLSLRFMTGDPAAPVVLQQADFHGADDTVALDLPPGESLLVQVIGRAGPYAVALGETLPQATLPVDATLSFEPVLVAAYEAVAQRLDGTLTIRNTGATPLTLSTLSSIGDERWRLDGLPEEIAVAPGDTATIPLALEIPADARDDFPISVDVALAEANSAPISVRAAIAVSTGVLPVNPHRFEPFPSAMLGGLNVASTALGAVVDDAAMAGLFDDVVDVYGIGLRVTDAPTIRLAGDREIPVAGVILQIPPGASGTERLADFAVEVSTDGTTFARVLTARLSPTAGEQAFLLPQATPVRAVRLIPLSAQGGAAIDQLRLAEFAVIAAPDFVLDPGGFDIARPGLGGHIVRTTGFGDQALTGEGAIWPGDRPVIAPAEREGDLQWTLGFRNSRAALIDSLTWQVRTDTPPEQAIREVEVFAAIDGPLGPWTSLGRWRVDTNPMFDLPQPVWARALAFRVVDPAAGSLVLPERIEVRERTGASILGAWGDLGRSGPYEAQLSAAPASAPQSDVSHDRLSPTALAQGVVTSGEVKRGQVEDWYVIDLPEGTRSLRADFPGALVPDVALTLVAADGSEIALEPVIDKPGTLIAAAEPGRWLLHVTQPSASVVVAWDTSTSVAGFYPVIDRMIRRLAWQLDADREAINLVPFRGEGSSFLMPKWSGDRADVYAALHAYPLNDSSSDAENALLFATARLAERIGTRAVVLVTDAAYSNVYENEALWAALEASRAGVFALYLPADADPLRARAQVNLMSDWAAAADGHVSRLALQGDGESAFRRVQAWLDRPATYAFALAADTSPPPPGLLDVQLADTADVQVQGAPAVPPLAMEIILDASGSMLQHLGPDRRIDIAKSILSELGSAILPDGLPVALRVFGHDKPDSCENELLVPLAPLDRDAFVAAVEGVQSVNLARTSIAATLRQAGQDLAGATGAPMIVLVTDGEETCGGDPLAEIDRLREAGIDVKLNIVGFAISDAATQRLLESWAAATGGAYFDAGDKEALATATTAATALTYTVLDRTGAEVAEGIVGGEPVELTPGKYTVRIGPAAVEQEISIKSGETATVSFR